MRQTNSLTIDGHDLGDMGIVILDGFELPLPEPKTYLVDVPGSDGVIDLTEFAGDIAYQQRQQTFELMASGLTDRAAQVLQTQLARLVHGRRKTFALGQDPGWTYAGRFALGTPSHDSCTTVWTWPLTVSADPYKTRDDSPLTWLINAAGGVTLTLPVGRRRVCPTIQVQRTTLVSHDGRTWTLQPGASRIRDLWLSLGDDELTINTYPTYSITAWADLGVTKAWADLAGETWATVAAGDTPPQASDTWAQHTGVTWASIGTKRWVELSHGAETGDEYAAYVQYDYQDL